MAPERASTNPTWRVGSLPYVRAPYGDSSSPPRYSPTLVSDDDKDRGHSLTRDGRSRLKDRDFTITYFPHVLSDTTQTLLPDVAGSTHIMERLSLNFPMAFSAQAEPVVPTQLHELPDEAVRSLLLAKRAASKSREDEISVMKGQVFEKKKQIRLLKTLIAAHKDCLAVSRLQERMVEEHAKGRGLAYYSDSDNTSDEDFECDVELPSSDESSASAEKDPLVYAEDFV